MIKLELIRDVKVPVRAHNTDAGIDFFVPNTLVKSDFSKQYELTGKYPILYFREDEPEIISEILLLENQSVLIPSGIKMQLPKNHALIFFNKSGVATKKQLICGSAVVDENYLGEVHLHLINTGTPKVIYPGEKILQGIVLPINYTEIEVVNSIDKESERGEGGFGSTGIN